MSANSSTLLPLANETQQTVGRSKALPKEKPSLAIDGSVVEAGKLRIRKNSVVGVMDQIRAHKRPLVLVDSTPEDSSELSEWFSALVPEIPESHLEPWGFVKHVRQYLWSISCLFAMMGIIVGIVGLCSFYFGVVLPFGLL